MLQDWRKIGFSFEKWIFKLIGCLLFGKLRALDTAGTCSGIIYKVDKIWWLSGHLPAQQVSSKKGSDLKQKKKKKINAPFRSEKGKRKVQGVPQSQTPALPRPQEEEETDKSKQAETNKRTKSTKISSLFPKRGNRNTKRTEKHKNKMTHGKTYKKSPRGINHKATKSKTNTGTTALERSAEQTTGGLKHFYS